MSQVRSHLVLADPNSTREERQLHEAALARIPLEFVVHDLQRRVTEHEVVSDVFMYIPFLVMFSVYFLLGRNIEANYMAAGAVQVNDIRGQQRYTPYQAGIMEEMLRGAPLFFNDATVDRFKSSGGATRGALDLLMRNFSDDADLAEIGRNAPLRNEPEFMDIKTHVHWIRWLREVFVPSTWDCDNPDHHEETAIRRRGATPMLGAARLRMLRIGDDACTMARYITPRRFRDLADRPVSNLTDDEALLLKARTQCYGPFDKEKIDRKPFCNEVNPANPLETLFRYHECRNIALSNRGEHKSYPCAGHVATIPFNASCNEVRSLISLLTPDDDLIQEEDEARTIDAALGAIPSFEQDKSKCSSLVAHVSVRMVMLEYFVYSVSTNAFIRVKAIIEAVPGGAVLPNYTTRVFNVWTTANLPQTVFEFIFFAFVLYFFRKMIFDWSLSYRKTGTYTAFLMDLWNLMEACNLVTLVVSLAFRWTWWLKSRSYVLQVMESPTYPEVLDEIEYFFSTQIYVNAVNVVITYLKVLKYLRLNDRLNVLTRTLELCQSDMLALLALFVFLHTGFAFSGMLLFGTSIKEFKNINTAFSTLMFAVVGVFDYDAMRTRQPELTPVFFWSYIFLGWMLFLNFFVVVLSEGFAQVNRTTTLQPIHVVVLRQLDEIRLWLRWPFIREWLYSKTLNRSRISLLIDAVNYLREHFELSLSAAQDLHVKDDAYMCYRDLEWWLPREVIDGLGETFLLTTWEDIVYEYLNKEKTSAQVVEREKLSSMIRQGLDAFMETAIPDFVTIELQAENLEVQLDAIPRLLCLRDRHQPFARRRGGGGGGGGSGVTANAGVRGSRDNGTSAGGGSENYVIVAASINGTAFDGIASASGAAARAPSLTPEEAEALRKEEERRAQFAHLEALTTGGRHTRNAAAADVAATSSVLERSQQLALQHSINSRSVNSGGTPTPSSPLDRLSPALPRSGSPARSLRSAVGSPWTATLHSTTSGESSRPVSPPSGSTRHHQTQPQHVSRGSLSISNNQLNASLPQRQQPQHEAQAVRMPEVLLASGWNAFAEDQTLDSQAFEAAVAPPPERPAGRRLGRRRSTNSSNALPRGTRPDPVDAAATADFTPLVPIPDFSGFTFGE